ncbi:hypothetical protein, partial [Mesorhizobium sp. M1329]|uniref:hypothetical protein n=1 Tax=Mesorhizobium sp. M1329 TaxID=2957083 RepID=UPI00333D5D7A
QRSGCVSCPGPLDGQNELQTGLDQRGKVMMVGRHAGPRFSPRTGSWRGRGSLEKAGTPALQQAKTAIVA